MRLAQSGVNIGKVKTQNPGPPKILKVGIGQKNQTHQCLLSIIYAMLGLIPFWSFPLAKSIKPDHGLIFAGFDFWV